MALGTLFGLRMLKHRLMSLYQYRRTIIAGCVFVLIFLLIEITWNIHIPFLWRTTYVNLTCITHNFPITNAVKLTTSSCPDVAQGMMKGKWRTRPMTSSERSEVEFFLNTVRDHHGLPRSMQRSDNRCGDVTYPYLPWFRALCNPEGPTPCCYNNQCESRSVAECQCTNCHDLRTPIHAEFSIWVPQDPRCEVREFTGSDLCRLLQETELILVGDSLMRHLYTALLLELSGHQHNCTLRRHVPLDVYKECQGMFLFSEKTCRKYIRTFSSFCNQATQVSYYSFINMQQLDQFSSLVSNYLHKPKTYILIGIGAHDEYDVRVHSDFVLPVINLLQSKGARWPQLIWATTHKFGSLKTPLVPTQSIESVHEFNDYMIDKLSVHNIPVFDTFNLTSGVMSPDGAHFGIGLNLMKAKLFLNLLHQLKQKDDR